MSAQRRVGVVVALAIGAGLLSLLTGRALAYDPTTWEIWARELVRGSLDTTGGASAWKPLPVFVDAPFVPLGSGVAVAAWLVVVRAAVVASAAAAWAIGARLGGRVGAVGAAALVLVWTMTRFGALVAGGFSEPLCAAAFLVAVWSALRRAWVQVLPALLVASLLRPEAWPLLIGSAVVVVVRAERRVRAAALVTVALLVVPAAWFLPDWVTTGSPFTSLHRDVRATNGGPLHTAHPGLQVLAEAWRALPVVVWVAVALLVTAVVVRRDAGRVVPRAAVPVVAAGLGWVAVAAAAAARHESSGDARYLLPGLTVLVAAGGGAAGAFGRALGPRWRARPAAATVTAAVLAATGVAVTSVGAVSAAVRPWRWQATQTAAVATLDTITDSRAFAVAAGCAVIATGPYQVPVVAWVADRPLDEVRGRGPAALLLVENGTGTPLPKGFRPVARSGRAGAGWTWWQPVAGAGRTGRGCGVSRCSRTSVRLLWTSRGRPQNPAPPRNCRSALVASPTSEHGTTSEGCTWQASTATRRSPPRSPRSSGSTARARSCASATRPARRSR